MPARGVRRQARATSRRPTTSPTRPTPTWCARRSRSARCSRAGGPARASVGELIADGVRATARVTAPTPTSGSCCCSRRWSAPRRPGTAASRCESATERDARAARRRRCRRRVRGDRRGATPGGLGDAPEHDVRAPARVSLREAMAAAAHRDSIASEYATGYAIVFDTGLPLLAGALRNGLADARRDRVTSRRAARLPPGHPDRAQGRATPRPGR